MRAKGRRTRWGWADEKARIERMCIDYDSLCRRTLYSKVIKSFVPELRSRKCFSCFGIPMFYVYVIYTNIMNVLRTGMNMSFSHIRIWLWYMSAFVVWLDLISSFNAISTFIGYLMLKPFL